MPNPQDFIGLTDIQTIALAVVLIVGVLAWLVSTLHGGAMTRLDRIADGIGRLDGSLHAITEEVKDTGAEVGQLGRTMSRQHREVLTGQQELRQRIDLHLASDGRRNS